MAFSPVDHLRLVAPQLGDILVGASACSGLLMRMYAHWLDGEYRKASTGVDIRQRWAAEDETAERVIKTLALFGGTLVLSDAQVVDSPVLWRLFTNSGFRRFLRTDPGFLELVARPVTRGPDVRWSIASAGLERAIIAGRIASPVLDGMAVISLFQDIVAAGPAADLSALLSARKAAADISLLFGFTELFRYFALSSSNVAEPLATKSQQTLYSVIETALARPDLAGEDRRQVEATKLLIDEVVENPTDRDRRAIIYNALNPVLPAHITAWKVVVQAWNVAAQKTACETGGSIGNMPRSVPLGAYIDRPADVMLARFDVTGSGAKKVMDRVVPEIPVVWDPGDLTWDEIVEIVENGTSGSARLGLKAALLSGAYETEDAVRQFANAVAPLVKGRVSAPTWWIWTLGPVAIRFGGPAAPMLGVSMLTGLAAEKAIVWAINNLRERVIAARVVESAKRIGV